MLQENEGGSEARASGIGAAAAAAARPAIGPSTDVGTSCAAVEIDGTTAFATNGSEETTVENVAEGVIEIGAAACLLRPPRPAAAKPGSWKSPLSIPVASPKKLFTACGPSP
jgi:hypothetical protein